MKPRGLTVALGLSALALGCSQGEPDDLFFLFGTITDHQGAPRPGAELVLSRSEGTGCTATFRLNLFAGPGGAHHDYRTASAAGTGEYLFELMRFELATPSNGPRCLRVRHDGQNGASSALQTFGLPEDVELADLPAWDGQAPTVAEGASGLEAQLAPLPWTPASPEPPVPGPDGQPEDRHAYDWVVEKDGQPAWHEQTSGQALRLTPELREDFGATVALEALALLFRPISAGPFGTSWMDFQGVFRSGRSGPLPAGRVPASRGASCSFRGEAIAGCPLTDGLLGLHALQPVPAEFQPPPEIPDQLALHLSAPIQPTLLVVRDLHPSYTARSMVVEGSADGVAWAELGRLTPPTEGGGGVTPGHYQAFLGSGQHFQLPLNSQGLAVRHLRLTPGDNVQLYAIRELSVFD